MPIYEYECKSCAQRFERRQSFSEPPITECPECGGTVKKVLQAVGIVFKGSGWYKTDSRPAESSGASGASSSDGKDGAGKDGAGKDGKTDASAKPADAKPAGAATSSSVPPGPSPSSNGTPAGAATPSSAGAKR